MAKIVFVLNGPNLNLLGTREPQTYGRATLKDVETLARDTAARHKLDVEFRQTNHEGELVDWIHEAQAKGAAGIILNAGRYTHTSVALRDAVASVDVPVIEVHLSNPYAREPFRHHSYVSHVAKGVICGLKAQGYEFAVDAIASLVGSQKGKT